MGDLYVNATTGMDAPARGTTLSDPLRTVTFAINEAVTRFGAALSTVHVAAGTYTEALGEEFPVLLPQNISLIGEGSDRTFLRLEHDLGAAWAICMQGGREITGITLIGYPLTTGSCQWVYGILLQQDGTYIHDVAIGGAAAGDFGFGDGIANYGVSARIERVQVSGCVTAFAGSTDGTDARCSIRNSRFDGAGISLNNFVGEISDNHFDSCRRAIQVSSYRGVSDVSILRNHFRACTGGIAIEPDPLASAMPYRVTVSHNTFVDVEYGVGILARVDATISDNTFELSAPWGSALTMGSRRSTYTISPIVKNNIMSKALALPAALVKPLIEIEEHSPILEGNSLGMVGADGEPLHGVPTIVIYLALATPNLGGGAGSTRSAGRNRFVTGGIQIFSNETIAPRTISARNNYWWRAPPLVLHMIWSHDFIRGDVDVDPRGGPITVDVDGAMSL
jgi:Protein of unknown function (DUF1565)